jgi:thymidylate kinase
VVEGMPGAGKTTLLGTLARSGHPVLGEYTDDAGAVLELRQHPHHGDEDAHLANWLRKSIQVSLRDGPMWLDRDWLTALAWSASTSGLRERAAWAERHLTNGHLILPRRWIVLDVPPVLSLLRRAQRLETGHPWSDITTLERLRDFYRDPVSALRTAHPGLARRIAEVPLHLIDATARPAELARAAQMTGPR